MSADTAEPSTDRSTSMIPSEYGSVAPTASKSPRTRCDTTISPPSSTCARSRARASSFSFANWTFS